MLPCKQREVGASPIASIFPFKLRGEVEAVEMGTLEVSESRCESCRRDCEANGLEAGSLSRLSGGQEKAGALPASPILLIETR